MSFAVTHGFPPLSPIPTITGMLEFYNTANDDVTLMERREHTNLTDIQWDPTGRYVVTMVSKNFHVNDTGYMLWSFTGEPRQRHTIDNFWDFRWRPRPPSLLKPEDIKVSCRKEGFFACFGLILCVCVCVCVFFFASQDIEKHWKDYQARFEAADQLMQTKASTELIEKRRRMRVSCGHLVTCFFGG